MRIAGMQKVSTLDYPGNLACVIFSPGCNYDCYFCHNREILKGDVPLMGEDEVLSFLKKRIGKLDGVVLTGGEPTFQSDLAEFAKEIRDMGFNIKLDTNGSRPDIVLKLINKGLVDYIAMDYKAPLDMYENICRHSAAGLMESLSLLMSTGIDYELRTTLIPELTPDIAMQMAKEMPVLKHYYLQLYRPPKPEIVRPETKLYTPMEIVALAEKITEFQPNTKARA